MRGVLIFTVTFILIALVGCESSGTPVGNEPGMMDARHIVAIALNDDDSDQSVNYTATSSFERFVHAVAAAEYTSAQLDITAPDYRSTVKMKDGSSQTFSFWIVGSNVGLMVKSGQNGHFRLPEASKQELLNLFESSEQEPEIEKYAGRLEEKDVYEITIAKSLAHGSVNPAAMVEYTDKETIKTFVRAIRTAEKMDGMLNTATPDYDIVVSMEDKKHAFHIWLSESSEHGMIMDVKETHTGYTLTKEATIEMAKMINEDARLIDVDISANQSNTTAPETDDLQAVRETAWNSLSDRSKIEVVIDWKAALVETAKVADLPVVKRGGKAPEIASLYKVTFETNNEILGPIRVFVDADAKEAVDYVARK